MKKHILTITFLFSWLCGYSQETAADPQIHYSYFQMLYHTGVFWSRSEYLVEQIKDGYKGLEARIGFQTTGKELWEQFNNYPSYGFGIHYGDLVADPEDTILGNPFSAFMFYSAPRARFGRFSLNTDLSIGLSYTTLIYDPVSNPFNDVVASHINLYFDFNVNLICMLSDRLDLKAGYGITHYSNGRIHMPQKGVNNWGWNMGLNYHFVQPGQKSLIESPEQKPSVRPEYIHTEVPEHISFEEIQFMYAFGVVEHIPRGESDGAHYFTSSFTADYALAFCPRMAVTFGMDMLYDGSLAKAIKGIPPEEVTTFQKMYLGSHLGCHFFINRLTILCNFGTYFLQHSNDRGFWFMRAGGRVRLTDHLHAHICIKTKAGIRADWIEWGMAYSFKIR